MTVLLPKQTTAVLRTGWILAWLWCAACHNAPGTRSASARAAAPTAAPAPDTSSSSCHQNMPQRFGAAAVLTPPGSVRDTAAASHLDMRYIPGGTFTMGATDNQGRADEYPAHQVKVSGFWMDAHEVTNAEFARFVKATGYVTTAERTPRWSDIQKQLPPGTPKPPDSLLVPAALVFAPTTGPVPLNDASRWWRWVKGANWKHPEGPGSSIRGKDRYPVVEVSYEDAEAYARWAHKRLPTEAEWEYAARGGLRNQPYPWGSQDPEQGPPKANTWQGHFPYSNSDRDGYVGLAPVGSYPPNGYGLYDMAGNVWEWTSDWYSASYYQTLAGQLSVNPQGPATSYDPQEPYTPEKVTKGGSFMCNASYCKGYRVSGKMKTSPDSGLENLGFRCVSDR